MCVSTNKWNDFKRTFDAINSQNPDDSEVKFALEFLNFNIIWDVITNQEEIDKAFIEAIIGVYKTILTDLTEVREYLDANTQIDPYDWSGHKDVSRLVRELAQSKYDREPFQRVIMRIESMDGDKLKEYLKRLVRENMTVGIEILEDNR